MINEIQDEKSGRLDITGLYLEVIKALEEQYELKASIEELKKIQEININKIEQKKSSLENLQNKSQGESGNSKNISIQDVKENSLKTKLESEIRSLENIIVENDQIMKEMDARLQLMQQKIGEWIKTCPKNFKDFKRDSNLSKSVLYETECSNKNEFENSFLDSFISRHPLESRKDDDLFKKNTEESCINIEINYTREVKRCSSKSSLPLKPSVKFPKSKNRKILKENSRRNLVNIENFQKRKTESRSRKSLKSKGERKKCEFFFSTKN